MHTKPVQNSKYLQRVTRLMAENPEQGRIIRHRVSIICSECSRQDNGTCSTNWPLEAIAKHFRARGWQVDAKITAPICPKCQEASSMSKVSPVVTDRRHQRRVIEAMMQYYNEEKGHFREGWSDSRISKELDLSEEYIRREREAWYGPMKISSEIVTAGKDLATIKDEIRTLSQMLDDLADRIKLIEANIAKALKA